MAMTGGQEIVHAARVTPSSRFLPPARIASGLARFGLLVRSLALLPLS